MDSSLFASRSSVAPAQGYTASAKALLIDPIRRLASRISSERAMHCGAAELRAMDDRLLADIGLTRELIEYLARYSTLPGSWGF